MVPALAAPVAVAVDLYVTIEARHVAIAVLPRVTIAVTVLSHVAIAVQPHIATADLSSIATATF